MYKKLHRRLTILFTGIAGAILIVMSVSYLYMSEKELSENYLLTFSSKTSSLISNIEQQNDIEYELGMALENCGGSKLYFVIL